MIGNPLNALYNFTKNMKIIALSLIFIATHVLGGVPAITLTPNKTEGDTDYSKQLIKKFNVLLESNKNLKSSSVCLRVLLKNGREDVI